MKKLKIGIIGAGKLGTSLARILVAAGYNVQLSYDEDTDTTRRITDTPGAKAELVENAEVVKNDVIVLAVRWENVEEALTLLRRKLKGKIVVDATNAFINGQILFSIESEVSSSLIVSSLIPDTSLVKAFNSLAAEWLVKDPIIPGGKRIMFISGDEVKSKQVIAGIIESIGFACIDLGNMKTGGLMQQGGGPLGLKNMVLLHGNSNEQ